MNMKGNPQNLVSLFSSEQTADYSTRPRPNQPLLKLMKTRKCTKKCKLYDRCRFMLLSKEKYDGRCALANCDDMLHHEKRRVIRTLIGTRNDMCQNLRDLVEEMENVTDKTDSKEYERLINTHMKVMDAEFGRKAEVKIESKNYNFNMNGNIERAFIERQQKEKDEKIIEEKVVEGECVEK